MSFDRETYQRSRIRELDRRVRLLEAEERRLYRLLGLALQVATAEGRECRPLELLEVLCAIDGTSPARPAWVEELEREQRLSEAGLVQLLRETDPAGKAAA